MAANFVLLEKIVVGAAGASSVTFNSIPQTGYTDLVVKMSMRATGATSGGFLTFNGSTTGYSEKLLYGNGSITGSASNSGAGFVWVFENVPSTYTANTFSNGEIYIPNYTSSNYKSVSTDNVQENNATTSDQYLVAGLWSNTAAITSINIASSSSFTQYSTFYLYGVAKLGTTPAIQPYATGGDTIMTDGTYWYHAFRSSGTFTPAKGLSCDVLVVAGGGGGGSRSGGGGGAGGLFYSTGNGVGSGTNYTVTVGAGGTAGSRAVAGTNGSNSVFGALTAAVGGGFGGSALVSLSGSTGGSGGGAANGATGSAGTSGQGFAGGSSNATSYDAGGGGGAGAVGANASTSGIGAGAGAGGTGVNTYSTWLNTTGTGVSGYIAGGGGGGSFGSSNHGAGGAGGGGAGADSAPVAGTANTGGGGGGAGNSANTNVTPVGANGGSGLVIVRYAV